jgi:hypothetical protein
MNPIEYTTRWLQTFVIGLQLCPFARLPFEQQKIRYVLEEGTENEQWAAACVTELQYLIAHPETETSLLIFSTALTDFDDYLDFLDLAEHVLRVLHLEGVIQIASFHPNYQFAGSTPDDVSNYTNRSPYPMLHFLREKSVQWAVESHPNVEAIPNQNIARLEALGKKEIKQLLHDLNRAD